MAKERLPWLDAAKGIGIILVVMGHIAQHPLIGRFIYSFHMPLFFFLSGIAFNFSRHDFFIRRHARSLLSPYFAFCLLSFLYWFVIERHFRPSQADPVQMFANIFYAGGGYNYIFNAVMWFLPCLFVIEVSFFLVNQKIHSFYTKIIFLFVCSIIGFVLSKSAFSFRLPWMMDTALICILFYAAGSLINEKTLKVFLRQNRKNFLITAGAGFFLCLCIVTISHSGTDLVEMIIPHPAQFYAASFAGIAASTALAMYFPALWLQRLGRMSLILMCIHEPVKRILLKVAGDVSATSIPELRAWPPSILMITIATVLVCVPIVLGVNRFFPWLTGRPRLVGQGENFKSIGEPDKRTSTP